MSNNPAGDLYDPPSSLATDFDDIRFSEVQLDELFWPNTSPNPNKNVAHRKTDESSAMNTKTRQVISMDHRTMVYQKI